MGERCKLPQRGPEQNPGRKRIWCIFWRQRTLLAAKVILTNANLGAVIIAYRPIANPINRLLSINWLTNKPLPRRKSHIIIQAYGFRLTWSRTEQGRSQTWACG